MKNERKKYGSLPSHEELRHEYKWELRYNFEEVTRENEDGTTTQVFRFNSLKSYDYKDIQVKKDELGVSGYPAVPAKDEWVIKNKLYDYNSDIVRARLSHFRTSDTVENSSYYFTFISPNNDVREWIPQIKIGEDEIIAYSEGKYKSLQNHVTLERRTPDESNTYQEI